MKQMIFGLMAMLLVVTATNQEKERHRFINH